MLPHLFSSRTRIKLLSVFLLQPQRDYFVRELTRLTDEQINSIRRELDNLYFIGLVKYRKHNNKKYYFLNPEFLIIDELTSIFKKLSDNRYDIVQGVIQCGDIDVLAISDKLVSAKTDSCDLVVVGSIEDKEKLDTFISSLETKHNREIRYVVFDQKTFQFRHTCNDKFLIDFFTHSPLVLIDKLKYRW